MLCVYCTEFDEVGRTGTVWYWYYDEVVDVSVPE